MRSVVVTGGSRGIGLEISRTLASHGYEVIAVARQQNDALAAAQRDALEAGNGVIHFRPCDLDDLAGLAGFAKSLHAEFGALYGLVNNAGIGTSGILATMPDQQVERLVRLNVLSPMLLTKYVVRAMMTGGGHRIVNISSIVATTGYPGLSVYSATKSSMLGFTRSLARELGSLGITVNAVAPGFVDTEMTQDLNPGQKAQIARRSALRRMPTADDVGSVVNFLMSDAAANITGTTITVDAGNTA